MSSIKVVDINEEVKPEQIEEEKEEVIEEAKPEVIKEVVEEVKQDNLKLLKKYVRKSRSLRKHKTKLLPVPNAISQRN